MQRTASSSHFVKYMKILYVVLSLVFPLAVLLIFGFSNTQHFPVSAPPWIMIAAYYSYWLCAMPIFFVYGLIGIHRFFPTQKREIFFLFFPLLFTLVLLCIESGIEHLLPAFLISATVFYIGVYSIMLVSLLPLIFSTFLLDVQTRFKDASKKTIFFQGALRLFVTILLYSPIVLTLWYSAALAVAAFVIIYGEFSFLRILFYVFQILSISISYYPKLRTLYNEGKL